MADQMFSFDFGANPSLPSGQGVSYIGSVSQTSAMSISGNQYLHIDTITGFPGDPYAYYDKASGYDSSLNAEMTAKINVSETNHNFGFLFGYSDQVVSNFVEVSHEGWYVYGSPYQGSFSDPNAFHVIEMKTIGASSYSLYVDGVLVASGTPHPSYAPSSPSDVYFGDGTNSGGGFIANLAYINYLNSNTPPSTAVPEPSSLALLGLGGLGLAFSAYRRRRAATAV